MISAARGAGARYSEPWMDTKSGRSFRCSSAGCPQNAMIAKLSELINQDQDHVLSLDIGAADVGEP